jgi:hypothetical protein
VSPPATLTANVAEELPVVPLVGETDSHVPLGGVVLDAAVKLNAAPVLETVIFCGEGGPATPC